MFALIGSFSIPFTPPQFYWEEFYQRFSWPFLAAEIAVGLILKFFLLRSLGPRSWKKSALENAAINLASSGLDFATVPLVGFVVDGFRNRFWPEYEGDGPTTWLIMLLILSVVHTVSEASVLRFAFSERLRKARLLLLLLINVVCLWIAIYGMLAYAGRHRPEALQTPLRSACPVSCPSVVFP